MRQACSARWARAHPMRGERGRRRGRGSMREAYGFERGRFDVALRLFGSSALGLSGSRALGLSGPRARGLDGSRAQGLAGSLDRRLVGSWIRLFVSEPCEHSSRYRVGPGPPWPVHRRTHAIQLASTGSHRRARIDGLASTRSHQRARIDGLAIDILAVATFALAPARKRLSRSPLACTPATVDHAARPGTLPCLQGRPRVRHLAARSMCGRRTARHTTPPRHHRPAPHPMNPRSGVEYRPRLGKMSASPLPSTPNQAASVAAYWSTLVVGMIWP
jgi:hypothetical protein